MTPAAKASRRSGARSCALQAIRDRVLRAILENRTPGFHFPGHFLGVQWRDIGPERARLVLPDGPHIHDARGRVDVSALAVFADIALGTAARLRDAHHERQATVHLQLQLTGAAVRGEIVACTRWCGSTEGTRAEYSLTEATIEAKGKRVAHACGKFVRLEPPAGVALAPLPWQRDHPAPEQLVEEEQFDALEREVVHRCDAALRHTTDSVPFIRRFWSGEGRRNSSGASRRLTAGPHVGNRVGHVHGGILLAVAAATADDAAPADMELSNLSAWYLRPGLTGELVARATLVHAGNTTALVRTQVKSKDGTHVIEAMTQHVAKASVD